MEVIFVMLLVFWCSPLHIHADLMAATKTGFLVGVTYRVSVTPIVRHLPPVRLPSTWVLDKRGIASLSGLGFNE